MVVSQNLKRLLVSLIATLAAACASSPLKPEESVPQKTETFTGTISPGQIAYYPFTIQNPGSVTVTITTWAPGSGPSMGLGLGAWDNAATKCNEQLSSPAAKVNTILTGNPQQAGVYCVALYDLGNLEVESNYTLTVQHY